MCVCVSAVSMVARVRFYVRAGVGVRLGLFALCVWVAAFGHAGVVGLYVWSCARQPVFLSLCLFARFHVTLFVVRVCASVCAFLLGRCICVYPVDDAHVLSV